MRHLLSAIRHHRLTKDARRLALLAIGVAFLLWLDSWLPEKTSFAHLSAVLNTMAVLMALPIAVHLIRRIIMPSVDIKKLVETAALAPISSAIVVAAMVILMVSLIWSATTLLH